MKKTSIVITVPLIVIAAVVAIVFAVKLSSQTTNTDTKAYEPKQYPGLLNSGLKQPSEKLGSMTASGGAAQGSTQKVSATSLSTELQATQDDGGASDISTLQKSASGL